MDELEIKIKHKQFKNLKYFKFKNKITLDTVKKCKNKDNAQNIIIIALDEV